MIKELGSEVVDLGMQFPEAALLRIADGQPGVPIGAMVPPPQHPGLPALDDWVALNRVIDHIEALHPKHRNK